MKNNHIHTRRLAALGLVATLLISSLVMLAPPAAATTQTVQDGVYEGNFYQSIMDLRDWTSNDTRYLQYLSDEGKYYSVQIYPDGYIYQDFPLSANYDIYMTIWGSNWRLTNDISLVEVHSAAGNNAGPHIALNHTGLTADPKLQTLDLVLMNYAGEGGATPLALNTSIEFHATSKKQVPVELQVRGNQVSVYVNGALVNTLPWTAPQYEIPSTIVIGQALGDGYAPSESICVNEIMVDTSPIGREKWVAVGDSITVSSRTAMNETYRYYLGERLGQYVIDEGIGSENTAQVLARFDYAVASHRPSYVIVECGINDYYTGLMPDQTIANLEEIAAKATSLGAIVYMLYVTPDNGQEDDPTILDYYAKVNAHIAGMANETVWPVDVWTPLASETNGLRPVYDVGDRVHLNAAGNEVVAHAIYETHLAYLRSVGPNPVEMAMDGVYAAASIMIVCAVIGGMITMVGRVRF